MRVFFCLLAFLSLAFALPKSLDARQSEYSDYLFVYFVGEGTAEEEQIYMSVSNANDPSSWTEVNGGAPVLTSTVGEGGVRDPSIIRSQDGFTFWIIATDLHVFETGEYDTETGSHSLVIWESNDLVNWSESQLAEVSPENAGMTWAPDAIWDPEAGQYLVHWTCNLKGDGWYIMKSYTSDFKTFSPAEKFLTGAGMDVTIGRDEASNVTYRISKNGPGELIEEASAPSLSGPWTVVSQEIGSGTIPAGEGPLFFQDNQDSTKWHMFIDDFTQGNGYIPFETEDIASGEWTASEGYELPPISRHGYVIPITEAEKAALTG